MILPIFSVVFTQLFKPCRSLSDDKSNFAMILFCGLSAS